MHKNNNYLTLSLCLSLTACSSTALRQEPPTATTQIEHNDASRQQAGPARAQEHAIMTAAPPSPAAGKDLPAVAHTNVWDRITDGLDFDRRLSHRTVQDKLRWYKRNQDYLDRVADRATPYLYYIVEELQRRNMPMELALLPIVESAYHPFAYSRSRASGIWQFIPGTGKIYGLKQNWWYDGRRDIIAATDAALRYLEKLNREFNGDWLHALAAYNSGERNVARAIARNRAAGKSTDFFSLRLPRETRGYVPSLLAVAEILANAGEHGIRWKAVANKPHFAIIDIEQQIDLATAADIAGMAIEELYTLNPGFNRWATDPDGPHRLLLPVEKHTRFLAGLNALPDNERIAWRRHVIARGETLGAIAARYKTSVATLRETNRLRGTRIYEGKSILIPVASKPTAYYSLSLDNRRFRGLKKAGSGEKYIYTIRRGDTLWDIGRHYGVSVRQLTAWNGMSSGSVLRPGQKLTLWFDEQADTTSATTVATSATAGTLGTMPVSYTVKRGDSLWLISRRLGVTVTELRQWNNLSAKKYLQPGQKLIIQRSASVNTET